MDSISVKVAFDYLILILGKEKADEVTLISHLILKLIEHILALISRSIARAGGAGEFSSDEIELGPVSEDQVGESEEDGKDDWAPEEVDVGVDGEHAVLVEQPRSVLHFWHEDLIIEEFF